MFAYRVARDSTCPDCIGHRLSHNDSRRGDLDDHQGLHEGERYCAALPHRLELHRTPSHSFLSTSCLFHSIIVSVFETLVSSHDYRDRAHLVAGQKRNSALAFASGLPCVRFPTRAASFRLLICILTCASRIHHPSSL